MEVPAPVAGKKGRLRPLSRRTGNSVRRGSRAADGPRAERRREQLGKLKLKKKEKELSQAAAGQMLSNIFEACDYEANRVPLEVLVSYTRYRRERHVLRWLVLVVLTLFLLVPVMFVTPEVQVSELNGNTGQPILQIQAASWIPIDKVTAVSGEYSLPVYEMGQGLYQVIPDRNGMVTVRVFLKNQQYTETEYLVENVDVEPPVLLSSRRNGDLLELHFQEEDGHIDYEGIYAVDIYGQTVYPVSYDESKKLVIFRYPDTNMNIFVSDEYENQLQLVLTIYEGSGRQTDR